MKKYYLNLQIPLLPKSLNQTLRTYRHKRNDINKEWYQLIALYCTGKRPPKPLSKAKIKIVRYYYKMLDYDGLVGSLKPVVDGLIHARIIIDDGWKITGQWDVDQVFRKKKDGPLLEIIVEGEIDESD